MCGGEQGEGGESEGKLEGINNSAWLIILILFVPGAHFGLYYTEILVQVKETCHLSGGRGTCKSWREDKS